MTGVAVKVVGESRRQMSGTTKVGEWASPGCRVTSEDLKL